MNDTIVEYFKSTICRLMPDSQGFYAHYNSNNIVELSWKFEHFNIVCYMREWIRYPGSIDYDSIKLEVVINWHNYADCFIDYGDFCDVALVDNKIKMIFDKCLKDAIAICERDIHEHG